MSQFRAAVVRLCPSQTAFLFQFRRCLTKGKLFPRCSRAIGDVVVGLSVGRVELYGLTAERTLIANHFSRAPTRLPPLRFCRNRI